MATRAQWIGGLRTRTLMLSASAVVAGTAIAIAHGYVLPGRIVLALVVGLALQIGANLANDYSDGVRGTDDVRVGPQRLVGSGAATPATVKRAAISCFVVGAAAGAVLIVLTGQWWIIAVGAVTLVLDVLAAWFYTGGRHPYGYIGLGDVSVLIFFGPVAVAGTAISQQGAFDWPVVVASLAQGLGACGVLMANNLRDIPTDRQAGKHTLATRLGDGRSRVVFVAYCAALVVGMVATVALLHAWWGLLTLAMLFWLVPAVATVVRKAAGLALVPVLKLVGVGQFVGAIGLLVGVVIGRWI